MSNNPAFKTYVGLALMLGLWVALFAHYGSKLVYHPGEIEKPAYPLMAEGGKQPAESKAAETQPAAEQPSGGADLPTLLASADVKEGEKISKKCHACHSLQKGGPNKVGPDLWDVVGRPVASHEGFSYSSALKGVGGDWTFEKLNHFLTNPKDFAPGTRMTFAGIKKDQERADLLAYLRTLSDNPKPLP